MAQRAPRLLVVHTYLLRIGAGYQERKVRTVAWIEVLQTGQFVRVGAQEIQVAKCPQGKNTTPT